MKFCSLSSGSSGNSIYIETKKSRFLIDSGLSGKRVGKLLSEIDVSASELDFILVTHEHSDHVQGVGVLSRRYDLPIIANERTWLAMDQKIGKIDQKNIVVFKSDTDIELRDVDIHPMRIYHDSVEAVGYVIESSKKKLSVLTDTGFVSEEMISKMMGSDLFFIESNHDPNMLQNGSYSEYLKKRVRGIRGHLSNYECSKILGELLTGMGEKVFLGHLSNENNLPILAYKTVSDYLTGIGMDIKKDLILEVAARYGRSSFVEL
ncbi:MAG: MBL fold metallo-hydrolase [Tissierellia bacterium]|nr:MBL fold metallo-hydrolase [Tissierellia bacterium]